MTKGNNLIWIVKQTLLRRNDNNRTWLCKKWLSLLHKIIVFIKMNNIESFCHVRNSKCTVLMYKYVNASLCVTIIRRLIFGLLSTGDKNMYPSVLLTTMPWTLLVNLWVAISYSNLLYTHFKILPKVLLCYSLNFNNLLINIYRVITYVQNAMI